GVAAAVPPTLAGSTVTVAPTEVSGGQTPLCTTARNWVVCARVAVVSGLAVELISVQVLPSVEDCHFTIPPACPLKLMLAVLPAQMVVGVAAAVPPTLAGSTVTVAPTEVSGGQTPLCTTARNWVVCARVAVVSGLAVELISVQVLPSVEDCHFTIPPTCPLKLMLAVLPAQMVVGV